MQNNNKSRIWVILIIVVIALWEWFSGRDTTTTKTASNAGTDSYTLMLYMCGSDLESDGGYASDDIDEILSSSLADEVNLLIYTGGTTKWYNSKISSRKNQIFKVENSKLVLVDDTIGQKYMSDPMTLLYFLNFARANYAADKYGLIFWDHGGGAVSGFGYDENNPDSNDTLTIDEIKYALDTFGTKLDFVGFDACLMGTVETAYALKDNADYLIASEETEPGTGWDYKTLLSQLSSNTSQSTVEFGKVIVDSFIKSNSGLLDPDATLSVVDLSKMDDVYDNLEKFMQDIKSQEFSANRYANVSKAISRTKAFADGDIDTIDLVDFANQLKVGSSSSLVSAINSAVVYNKVTRNVKNSNGLSLYFPNEDLSYYDAMLEIYENIGFGQAYMDVITEYVNLMAGGSKPTYTINNHTYQNENYYQNYSWYDYDLVNSYSDYYSETKVDETELEVEDKGDYYALHLTDEEWNNIVSVESSVWYDDGEGYLDLGIDSYFEQDEDGDLMVTFDGNWIAINENIVRYEVTERTDDYEEGKVPALLNDREVNIILYWDKENPDGVVLGAEPVNAYGNTTMYGKGLIEIKKGDRIDFLVDYYDYDGNFDDEYYLGDTLVVGRKGLTVSYEWIGDGECLIYYILKDIYNNVYYTEPVIVY
ncbi:MAG: clostripain [Clostridia bacterium]|nr:clostripain [Clostridia bacterium]